MRMFNPEWEAIKEFEHAARARDVQFDLTGLLLPVDHGYRLFEEIARHLPWLRDTQGVGIHPVHGAPSGRDANLVINRRVKLVLRIPLDRLADVRNLVGKRIDPGSGELMIGAMKERTLTPFATIYSSFVHYDCDTEQVFLAAARAELDALGVSCGLIPGKERSMLTPNGVIGGYSLLLHDIGLKPSLLIQEQGLGLYRGYGCGIFVPHKSIKEVGGS